MKKITFFKATRRALNALMFSISFFGLLSSCTDDDKNYCPSDAPLKCDTGKCCQHATPWSDGHGTCYSSQNYCRQSGWNCVKCWE